MKSGFIAIIGRPNAGKSSLLNALIGEKVAIVSPKPQTTRNKIVGILNESDYQIVFVDTPGIIKPKNKLGEFMMDSVKTASEDVDAVIIVIDASKGLTSQDVYLIEKYKKFNIIVAFTKMDLVNYEQVFPELEKLNSMSVKEVVPVSAKKGKNLDELKNVLKKYLSSNILYYPDDMYTDRTERFMVSEIIREKALLLLKDEIPHGVGVNIVRMNLREDQSIYDIDADIYIEKSSHKPIVIGKDGAMLKTIGEYSRKDMEKLLNKRVNLKLWVRIKEDWRDDNSTLNNLGYRKQ